ncbi:MAG: hypothetical protein KGJ23_11745 [Euryarchaeota archaeon]|nr:hypothetical protein [Euryarchaeota archaeon]MDE1837268.1 hypothetical protein [Euryarchaeota archaeon]MDE1879938.1 hypothetical protein [Euryarchaeota archaeon]MDE2045128.1 hypothetical protein [Thermoplasmata archaeon]
MKREKDDPEDSAETEATEAEEGSKEEAPKGEESKEEKETAPPMSFSTTLRRGLRTYRFAISIAVLVLGSILCLIGLFAWTPLGDPGGSLAWLEQPLKGTDSPTGSYTGPDWTLAMLPGGGLMALIGAYLVGVYMVARRRFEHLMKTRSKAEFLRNVTEAEDLLWDLTPEDEVRLVRKKLELKIRV